MTLKALANSKSMKNKFLLKLIANAYSKFTQITCTSKTQIESIKKIIPNLKTPLKLVRTGVNIEALKITNSYILPSNLNKKKNCSFCQKYS